MKNITLSADEHLIEEARQAARSRNKTLNQLFREWLADVASRENAVAEFRALMKELDEAGVDAGRKFTREEMNER